MRRLYLIFFASGFAGLIYESIWTHYLKLFLGHAAYAQTLVLAIFMGGMAVGSGLASRFSTGIRQPLRIYAAIECAIGLCAIAFHPVFLASTETFFTASAAAGLSGAAFVTAKWTLATMLILPQSILLGATFPLFAAAATRARPQQAGHAIATLYFTNSLGGTVGVLASGFIMIPSFGLPGTIIAAGVVNLAIAALAARLPAAGAPPADMRDTVAASRADATFRLLIVVSFLTGASSFIYEVGWIRMLSLVLGSATHSFELMLSSFILGLALGGLWVRTRIDATANAGLLLGYVQIAMGLAAVATLPLHNLSFDLIGRAVQSLPRDDQGYAVFNLIRYGVASLIMFPAAFYAGMTLPLATRLLFSHCGQGERAIGLIYATNTVGAIAGVVFAVHIGLPLLGLDYLIASGAMIDVLLGGALLVAFAGRARLRQVAAATMTCAAGAAIGSVSFDPQKLASGVFRTGRTSADGKVIAMRHGKTATISIESDGDKVSIRTNGKPDASAQTRSPTGYAIDEVTMTLIGTFPLLLHPNPEKVANIGFGSGITGETLLDDPRVRHLDTIEIEPAMVELARYFDPLNRNVYQDPRSHIHLDDAKSFFATEAREPYDLIVSEPSNPWVSGVSGLFSVEFYRHVKRYLKDDGLFAQWLQVYELNGDRAVSVIKAVSESFDDYLIIALDYGDLLIVARPKGTVTLAADAFDRLAPQLLDRLHRIDVANAADTTFRVVGNKQMLRPWLENQAVPANSDFHPYLDKHAERDRFTAQSWSEVFSLGQFVYPIPEMLGVRPTFPLPACLTINRHFGTDPVAAAGRVAYEMLVGPALASRKCLPAPRFDPDIGRRARELIDHCKQAPMDDVGFAAASIAMWVLPFLSRAEGADALAQLGGSACLAPSRPEHQVWPELLHALAERSPARLAHAAESLLAQGQGATPSRARFLLTLAMLGAVAADDRAGAERIWHSYASHIVGDAAPDLALAILHAQARSVQP